MTEFRKALIYAGVVFIGALLVYTATLAPSVTLVDSGELIVTARYLGVAHPPGFPLYIMLAHLASLFPWGNVAVRVNFASALFAALAAAMLTLVVVELLHATPPLAPKKRRPNKKSAKVTTESSALLTMLAPAVGASLLLAFSRTLWSYATVAEVYTLNTLLIVTIVFLMLRWRRDIEDKWLYAAAFAFGLGLGVHHVTVGLLLPALAILVYRTEGIKFFTSKRLLYAALLSLGSFIAVYSYLPIAAARGSIINWGDPRSLQQIWWHITGRQYQVFFAFNPESVGQQLSSFCALALRQFGRWWLPLAFALAGVRYSFQRDRTIFWFLAVAALADIAYTVGYDIAEDKDAYYLPSFIGLAIFAGFGLRWLLELALLRQWSQGRLTALALLLAVVVPMVALSSNWPYNNRRNYFIAQDYVENIQSTIATNGLLLTLDWQIASPMLYTREIEHRRPDVKVIDVNLLRRAWYFDYLSRAYPQLLDRSRDKVARFTTELQLWEQNPEAYNNDSRLTARISSAFHELLQSFVRQESQVAPVYVTSDFIFFPSALERPFTDWLLKNYSAVPRGLVFEVMPDRAFHDPGELSLETRGLTDGKLRFESDDVVRLKVLPAYAQMFLQRGRYLSFYNEQERAVAAFQQALVFDPDLKPAREALGQAKGY